MKIIDGERLRVGAVKGHPFFALHGDAQDGADQVFAKADGYHQPNPLAGGDGRRKRGVVRQQVKVLDDGRAVAPAVFVRVVAGPGGEDILEVIQGVGAVRHLTRGNRRRCHCRHGDGLPLLAEEDVHVPVDYLLGLPFLHHRAVVKQDGLGAVGDDLLPGMGDQQDARATLLQLVETIEAFGLKFGVTNRQGLVHHQDVGPDHRLHGKGQPHRHAAGIGLHRLADEIADVGEVHDVVKTGVHLRLTQAEDRAVHEDVFLAGELRVEAGAEFQQRSDPSPGLDAAFGRVEGAADHLQQG